MTGEATFTEVQRAVAAGEPQRHAAALTLALVTPFAAVAAETAHLAEPDFPRAVTFVVALSVGVVAVVLTQNAPKRALRAAAGQFAGVLVLARLVRFTTPTPPAAWASFQAGEGGLLSGRVLVPLLLFGSALIAGQRLTMRVATTMVGTRAGGADRDRERSALQLWLGLTGVLLLAGAAPAGRSPWVATLLVLGPLAGLVVLADLRIRLAGDRDVPLFRGGRATVATRTVAGTVLVAVVAVTVAVALLPPRALAGVGRPSEWVGTGLDWDLRPPSTRGEGGDVTGRHVDGEEPDDSSWRLGFEDGVLGGVDDPPWWVVAALVAVVLWLVFRPGRWRELLRRLWRLARGTGAATDPDDGTVAWDGDDEDPGAARWRQALQRLRPRPRDPRHAIVHDYLRVERLLAREDTERPRGIGETPLEHADRVAFGEAHAELARLTARARFAPAAPAPANAARALELRHAVERLLRDRAAADPDPADPDPAGPDPAAPDPAAPASADQPPVA